MKTTALLFLFLTIALNSHAQSKGKKTSTKEKQTSAHAIVGTWKLLEFADLDATTHGWTYPYGKKPNGYFSYSKNGIVNINISSEVPLQIPADSIAVFKVNFFDFTRNYALGYFGTYTVDEQKSIVTHRVTGGTIPQFIDTDQIRPFVLKSDTLTLGDGKTWKRVLVRID